MGSSIPPEGTVERWAHDYVLSTSLEDKLRPPTLPACWEMPPTPRRLAAPGRPPELRRGKPRFPRGTLETPEQRARAIHVFLHHELQAAELMAWACLAFAETPQSFRRGLLGILADEIRHMKMYQGHLDRLGFRFGDFEVNDWFWYRVPQVHSPAEFVATLGIGFEGGNLDHSERFAQRFRAAGDEAAARIQEQVGREEVPHVAFAVHWYRELQGELEFEQWKSQLPEPLSPMVMSGEPINRAARAEAGLDSTFLDELERWRAQQPGS